MLQYVEPDEEITASSHIKNDCGFTSFDLTCLYSDICGYYGIDVTKLDVKNIKTVGQLYEAIENNKTKN